MVQVHARGIGREITRALAEKGCNVVVADMNLEGAQKNADDLKNEFGCDSMAVSVNVTDADSVGKMFEDVFAKYGKIDILCNNAGITEPVTIDDMTKDDFLRIMNVNLVGTFLCSKLVIPYMVKGNYGRIVNISSVSAKCGGGVYGGAHYCAAKAGIIAFAHAQAMELCKKYKDMITVNCVCPGLIATDIRAELSDEKRKSLAQNRQWVVQVPQEKLQTPSYGWLLMRQDMYLVKM
ncbi:MAG: SDR family NAD(P)-dependent oxidoreductase [Lachnospiraceae bacterium]